MSLPRPHIAAVQSVRDLPDHGDRLQQSQDGFALRGSRGERDC